MKFTEEILEKAIIELLVKEDCPYIGRGVPRPYVLGKMILLGQGGIPLGEDIWKMI